MQHLGRVGAVEERRGGDDPFAPDAEVQRQVMPLGAPPPGIISVRIAEHGEVVAARIACPVHLARRALLLAQDQFVIDNRARLFVTLLRQRRLQHALGQPLLFVRHRQQRQAVPVQRRVVPEQALAVEVTERGAGALLRVQALQQVAARRGHLAGRFGVPVGLHGPPAQPRAGLSSSRRRRAMISGNS